MDGAVHTAAAEERRVRGVHESAHLLPGDVTFKHRASGFKQSRPLEAAPRARRLPPRRQELALERRAPVQDPRNYTGRFRLPKGTWTRPKARIANAMSESQPPQWARKGSSS